MTLRWLLVASLAGVCAGIHTAGAQDASDGEAIAAPEAGPAETTAFPPSDAVLVEDAPDPVPETTAEPDEGAATESAGAIEEAAAEENKPAPESQSVEPTEEPAEGSMPAETAEDGKPAVESPLPEDVAAERQEEPIPPAETAGEGESDAIPSAEFAEQPPEAAGETPGEPIPSAEVEAQRPTLAILGEVLVPGERRDITWSAGQSFEGQSLDTTVMIVHGREPGPVLCLTAAIHGDELNGVEIVRRVVSGLDPGNISGTMIGVPIVNILGFTRASRYLPDRRDLNRYFPGNPRGSAASRIAASFFQKVVRHCEYLVDFHTGSLKRSNLPQLRADLSSPKTYEFTRHFGPTVVLHHGGGRGTLRRAAADVGIAAVTFELGEPNWLQLEHVKAGVAAMDTLLSKLKIVKRFRLWSEPPPIYYASRWLRAERGGILLSGVKLGQKVREGDLLGSITNPLTSSVTEIRAPLNGRVLGMALDQFVLPGFATFHIGIATEHSEELLSVPAEYGPDPDAEPDEFTADFDAERLPYLENVDETEPE